MASAPFAVPLTALLAEPVWRHATLDYEALREAGIERMADAVEQHLDWGKLDRILA